MGTDSDARRRKSVELPRAQPRCRRPDSKCRAASCSGGEKSHDARHSPTLLQTWPWRLGGGTHVAAPPLRRPSETVPVLPHPSRWYKGAGLLHWYAQRQTTSSTKSAHTTIGGLPLRTRGCSACDRRQLPHGSWDRSSQAAIPCRAAASLLQELAQRRRAVTRRIQQELPAGLPRGPPHACPRVSRVKHHARD
jgi:hypothetical protein